ncbi:MAG: fatty acid--CoA ligase [Thermoleophilaceae bacterium]
MLEGLVQHDYPLTIQHILERMRRIYGNSEIVTLTDGGSERATYGEVVARVDRLCGALRTLGIGQGDRVATFAWNSQNHLEAYLAAPCMGAVLHTLNLRLFPEQLTYIANHAEDQVILVEDSLVPLLEKVAPTFETVRHYIVMGDGDPGSLPNALRYEELLADAPAEFEYPELDDRMAAGLCYTSGTTGDPKGVLYSHRSDVLHSFGTCLTDTMGISSADRVLPIVPMFHANAWGIPYAAGLVGADLVMPSSFMRADAIAGLIERERVTISAAVPTVWMDLLRHADGPGADLSSLRTVICGGAAVPLTLMRDFEERHGVRIIQAWGMTEMSPLGTVARPPGGVSEEDAWHYRDTAGRIMPLVEARLVTDDGTTAPFDGESTGELEVRGPWIASAYYNDPRGADRFDDGWLRTGDIAAIDEQGFVKITDRSKDVIKSGGEWISSVELEGELMAHPAVAEAAVIARPDERWSERPLACVVLADGAEVTVEELRDHLRARVAKWWVPEEFAFIDEVPKTSVGKFDKKVLRQRLADGELAADGAAAV